MKILAIGDFHGKFPEKLKKRLKKEEFDLILSPGDYCGNRELAKLYFKYVYSKDESNIPREIMKKIKKLDKLSVQKGLQVIKEIKGFRREFYGVCGNWDPRGYEFDIGGIKEDYGRLDSRKFLNSFKNNMKLIDFKYKKLKEVFIVGGGSSTSPGKADKKRFNNIQKMFDQKEARERIHLIKKHYINRNNK